MSSNKHDIYNKFRTSPFPDIDILERISFSNSLRRLVMVVLLTVLLAASLATAQKPDYHQQNEALLIENSDISIPELAGTTTFISQHGITWTFDKEYEYGQFVNGDYWVVGPVNITRITPDFFYDGVYYHNGYEINPNYRGQGFDSRGMNFDISLINTLPFTLAGNNSVVKAISRQPYDHYSDGGCGDSGSDRECLIESSVLTVLTSAPEGNGAGFFRPAYSGNDKTLYKISNVKTELLPTLDSLDIQSTLDLQRIIWDYDVARLDHMAGGPSQYIHLNEYMSSYGADHATRTSTASLMLMLDYTPEQKLPLVIGYIQSGIDHFGAYWNGTRWNGDGGHGHGRLLPMTLTSILLDDSKMKQSIAEVEKTHFGELSQNTFGKGGIALYGDPYWKYPLDSNYWEKKYNGASGMKQYADPYGYIDGHEYFACCSYKPWKYAVLAANLMPEIYEIWKNFPVMNLVDRYSLIGLLKKSDFCAPATGVCEGTQVTCTSSNYLDVCQDNQHCDYSAKWSSDYQVIFGPDPNTPGDCIRDNDESDGLGREPHLNGTDIDLGYRGSAFGEEMWSKYRELYNPVAWCGDNVCNGEEDWSTCSYDCILAEATLLDVITAIRVIAGVFVTPVDKKLDRNVDGKIGIEDVIFLLQELSGGAGLKP